MSKSLSEEVPAAFMSAGCVVGLDFFLVETGIWVAYDFDDMKKLQLVH